MKKELTGRFWSFSPWPSSRQQCNNKAGKEDLLTLGMVKADMEKGEKDEKIRNDSTEKCEQAT